MAKKRGGRGTNRRVLSAAYFYLERYGNKTTTQIHEYLIRKEQRNTPNKNRLGQILSRSPLFDKVGMVNQNTVAGNNGLICLWEARPLKDIVERALVTKIRTDKLPVYFRKAINEARKERGL